MWQKCDKNEIKTRRFFPRDGAFLKILEDKNKKSTGKRGWRVTGDEKRRAVPLLLVLLLSIDIVAALIIYIQQKSTSLLVNSSIDVVGVQLGELLHNLHALVFVLLLRLQLVLALVPLQTRVVEQLRVQFLQHFTNVNGQTVHGGVPVRHRRPFQASEHDWDDHVSILCY